MSFQFIARVRSSGSNATFALGDTTIATLAQQLPHRGQHPAYSAFGGAQGKGFYSRPGMSEQDVALSEATEGQPLVGSLWTRSLIVRCSVTSSILLRYPSLTIESM